MADLVNAQITDAITQTNVKVLGEAPAQSMGMVYQTMAHSLSLSMQNAVTAQTGMQQLNAAIISTACQKILSLTDKT
ncbi:RebB family R body protein [Aphanothece sacrum]|uniref:RebB-like protein n=1 Tax=Aphanothece sacrum FPU1 TaxID=1920663 RepID=A0A401ILH5_APHSA|nr:RebB family R body protein [Aphanothece sacrum]GBF82099.1 RebB-like protein [Aphanothece sacrum FPU1]